MIPALLYALATLDGALAGYRAAAGRSAVIDKSAYYRRAVVRGMLAAQMALALIGAAVVLQLALSDDRGALYADFVAAGRAALVVFVPYTILVGLAFIPFAMPSTDLRVLTSVLIFGPFTLVRPLVVLGGIVWGFAARPTIEVAMASVVALATMISLERLLDRYPPLDE